MNNEEKILVLLEKQSTVLDTLVKGQEETNQRLDKLETDVSVLKTDVSSLKTDVSSLKTDVSVLKTDLAETKELVILMEHDNKQQFGILHDGYKLVYDKLEPIPPIIENLQEDIFVIKSVITAHSQDISTLMVAT